MARENYAILIGANQYQNLDERWWLRGRRTTRWNWWPPTLTTEAPVPFPADPVTLLTDGVEGVQAATLGAIREAFAKVTAEAQPGDFVYLHFSGHGTQGAGHP